MMFIVDAHYSAHQIHQDIKVILILQGNVCNIVKLVIMHLILLELVFLHALTIIL
jgi:hypothetical protein